MVAQQACTILCSGNELEVGDQDDKDSDVNPWFSSRLLPLPLRSEAAISFSRLEQVEIVTIGPQASNTRSKHVET